VKTPLMLCNVKSHAENVRVHHAPLHAFRELSARVEYVCPRGELLGNCVGGEMSGCQGNAESMIRRRRASVCICLWVDDV